MPTILLFKARQTRFIVSHQRPLPLRRPASTVIIAMTRPLLMAVALLHFPSVWLMRSNKSSLPETHALPVYLWACSVNCSLITEWSRCWFCPAPLANLPPIRIHHSPHRMIGVEQSTAACAYRSRRREGRCLNSRTLLWPGLRWTAEMRREPPYRYLAIWCPKSVPCIYIAPPPPGNRDELNTSYYPARMRRQGRIQWGWTCFHFLEGRGTMHGSNTSFCLAGKNCGTLPLIRGIPQMKTQWCATPFLFLRQAGLYMKVT